MKRKIVFLLAILGLLAGLVAVPVQAATPDEINASIQKGLDWLVAQQNPVDGSWSNQFGAPVAQTGFAVLKLEDRAFELGYSSPFDPAYSYSLNVTNGLNYIFSNAAAAVVGICFSPGWNETYSTGIAMMAIAASKAPARLVATGPYAGQKTYKQVLQANVDYFAWGQVDAPSPQRGGWGYGPNQGWADNSNTGYAVLCLRYAEADVYGFKCNIPPAVKIELGFWITYIQRPDGGSDYDGTWGQSSLLRTGNLLFEMAFVGDTTVTPRVLAAIGYIQNNWLSGWDSQTMYCLMKGFQSLGIDIITVGGLTIDWFNQFAELIIMKQNPEPDGYWDTLGWSRELDTVFCLLTLEKVSPPPATVEGWMTGVGSVFTKDGTRVTHGFELYCDPTKGPNNLQVNWGKANKFHLEKLTAASCSDNPNIVPNPPPAGFDTCTGAGTGRYNGVSGATAKWTFTDAGEPGKNDTAKIEIWDTSGKLVLSVSGKLAVGNHQAHAK